MTDNRRGFSREQAVEIASGWCSAVQTDSDRGHSLYAFVSSGRVQSEDHRKALLTHLNECKKDASRRDTKDLNMLARYFIGAAIEEESMKSHHVIKIDDDGRIVVRNEGELGIIVQREERSDMRRTGERARFKVVEEILIPRDSLHELIRVLGEAAKVT